MTRTRLHFLLAGFVLSASLLSISMNAGIRGDIRRFTAGKDAITGVAVITPEGKMIRVGNCRKYPLMSVFKLHQAMAVADSLDRAGLPLSTRIPVYRKDMLPDTYSPMRDHLLDSMSTADAEWPAMESVARLLQYTLQMSDNNACDILFRHFGGPRKTEQYIRSLGIRGFSISVNEEMMHADLQDCYLNWSHPSQAARLVRILEDGGIYTDRTYSDFIVRTMEECTTGTDRLAAPLAGSGAVIGHKTGTGDRNGNGKIIGTNDIGFVRLPDGRRYFAAVFVKDSALSAGETSAIIAEISRLVYEHISQN